MQDYIMQDTDDSSSDDDDEVVLFALDELREISRPRLALGLRPNLQDFSDMECDQFFRFA